MADERRRLNHWQKAGLPIAGVLENRGGYACPQCGMRTDLFGRGGGGQLAEELSAPFLPAGRMHEQEGLWEEAHRRNRRMFAPLYKMWKLAPDLSSRHHEACRSPLAEAQAFQRLADVAQNATMETSRRWPMSNELKIEPIGVIETPFRKPAGTPIQPSRANGARGRVRVERRFWAGLQDLAGFERIWLIYWLHRRPGSALLVTPFLDQQQRGVFATRAPARPTPIGMSAVRLIGIEEGVLEVADVDMIDGTPLVDIKPYVPEFDSYPGSKAGWLEESNSGARLADGRFGGAAPTRS